MCTFISEYFNVHSNRIFRVFSMELRCVRKNELNFSFAYRFAFLGPQILLKKMNLKGTERYYNADQILDKVHDIIIHHFSIKYIYIFFYIIAIFCVDIVYILNKASKYQYQGIQYLYL